MKRKWKEWIVTTHDRDGVVEALDRDDPQKTVLQLDITPTSRKLAAVDEPFGEVTLFAPPNRDPLLTVPICNQKAGMVLEERLSDRYLCRVWVGLRDADRMGSILSKLRYRRRKSGQSMKGLHCKYYPAVEIMLAHSPTHKLSWIEGIVICDEHSSQVATGYLPW